MRKILLILMLLFLIILVPASAETFPETKAREINTKITAGLEHFKNNRFESGFQTMLDAILLTMPYSNLPKDIENKILNAKIHFSDGVPKPEGIKLIREALLLVKPTPGKLDPTLSIAGNFKKKVGLAQAQLIKGNADKVVELLMEAILVTWPQNH
jgi:hypothetical protein